MTELEASIMAYRCKARDNVTSDKEIVDRLNEIKDKKEILKEIDRPTKASQESLLYFFPLINWIKENYNIDRGEIFLGVTGSKEYKIIKDSNFYFYDFTIPSIKLIIEYDGAVFHPDRNLPEKDLSKWKSPYGIDGLEVLRIDTLKDNIARDDGFNILRVRSDEHGILDKMKLFFKDCYENSKNN